MRLLLLIALLAAASAVRVLKYEYHSTSARDRVEASATLTQNPSVPTKWIVEAQICNRAPGASMIYLWPGFIEVATKLPLTDYKIPLCLGADGNARCEKQGVCPDGRDQCSQAVKKFPCVNLSRELNAISLTENEVPTVNIRTEDNRVRLSLVPV